MIETETIIRDNYIVTYYKTDEGIIKAIFKSSISRFN